MKTLLDDVLDGDEIGAAPSLGVPRGADAVDAHREILFRKALERAISEDSFSLACRILAEITGETNEGLYRWLWTLIKTKAAYAKPVSVTWIRKSAAKWMMGQEKLKRFNATMKNAAAEVAEAERGK